MRLIEIIKQENYKTISIIGLAKNAGKTVTLNYLIEEAKNNNIIIGITSTGRDGENLDLVTDTQKPSILVTEGMFIATAKKALMLSDAKVEILETTGINTPMGEVIIVKVRQRGNMQIAGPVSAIDMKYISRKLKYYGAEVVFIDGAIDRKAVSSPVITDACVISTGAVLSRDMKKVIEKTAHTVGCYTLKQVDENVKKLISIKNKSCIIQNTGDVILPDIETSITGGKKISELIDKNTTHVFIKGAVTSILLRDLCQNEFLKNFEVVIEDGTKVFVDINIWNELKRKGLKVATFNTIKVIAVSLNPVSPSGYFFDSEDFKNKIKHFIPNIKIVDVVSGGDLN
ncbi:hypothetical protein [Sedimentibacter sp. MB31-C6]|uniref:lysine 5,6-aminomutase reactivase subunit KamB n=1 Tax=Sedimentibacter sp. MB31-C6 TaxID=3109366 RepID=UPI002DDDA45E|nr:hypothetical protein [Sedimentibacter sp. MB36-C1]WSI05410.1 hypothetical protein U8307_06370 [Sedimentibacter sp. MB36-C1]